MMKLLIALALALAPLCAHADHIFEGQEVGGHVPARRRAEAALSQWQVVAAVLGTRVEAKTPPRRARPNSCPTTPRRPRTTVHRLGRGQAGSKRASPESASARRSQIANPKETLAGGPDTRALTPGKNWTLNEFTYNVSSPVYSRTSARPNQKHESKRRPTVC